MKNLFPLIFAIFLVSQNISSQNTKLIDSLKLELESRKTDDSIKVSILTRLHENLMFSKPEEARKYAELELEISKKINYKRGLGVGNMHLGNYYENRIENDSASHYFYIAKKYFEEVKSQRGIIFINHSLASIESIRGNYDNAIKLTEENIKLISETEKGNSKIKFIGAQYSSLSGIYIQKGNYKIALTKALKAIELFEEINDLTRKADALKQVGDIETALENNSSALKYYEDALKIYDDFDDITYMAYTANSIGIVYKELNDFANAKKYQNMGISLAREVSDNMSLSNALHNLGELYIIEKNYKKASDLLTEAKDISEKENIPQSIIYAYNGLAKVDYGLNKPYDALNKIDKAIAIAKPIGALPQLKELYAYRSFLLEHVNKNKEAIFYLKESQKLNDSVFSLKESQQIEELKTIYEIEKKEAEIALQEQEINTLNTQAKNDKLTISLYSIGMFSFLAIASLLYFGFKQRMKKNKIEREKQEEIYKQEIAFKKKELTSQTLHLVQKNTFINELRGNLEKIKQSPELFKVEFRRLVMLLKKESAEDKDWELFKSYFSEVHNDFDIKIKAIAEDISEKEIRLASYIRMNLSTKEIASILNVLPESVIKSKYRLKKKLQLDKDTDLNSFLNDF